MRTSIRVLELSQGKAGKNIDRNIKNANTTLKKLSR
jgi:hypothetical protein